MAAIVDDAVATVNGPFRSASSARWFAYVFILKQFKIDIPVTNN